MEFAFSLALKQQRKTVIRDFALPRLVSDHAMVIPTRLSADPMSEELDNPIAVADERPMLFDLLKVRQGEAFNVMKYYESAVTVFLVITGGLLKFAFDQNATPPLRRAFEVMGLAMGAMGLLAIVFAERHRRFLKADIAYLANRLSLSIPADSLSVQWYAIVICCSVFVASIVAWSYLIMKHVWPSLPCHETRTSAWRVLRHEDRLVLGFHLMDTDSPCARQELAYYLSDR